ncbi:MAG: hypothetical protein ABIF01_00305 [Candidatus Micrarchaeota archaeon]
MAKREREGTEWGMIASGEGANKIAIQYLAEFQNKYLSDRILLLNTTASDIRPEKAFGSRITPEFNSILQKIKKEKTCIFGSAPSGAGNVWKIGEEEAAKDFETIKRYFANSQLAQADVILGLTTLGGGTGNGSLPYIINQLKSKMPTASQSNYISLGIWPLYSEASQRHFNAVCGFTRLLKYGREGKRNSELVIIAHNSEVAKLTGSESSQDKFNLINQEIIKAVDMMVAPSGKSAEATIDVADYYQIPTSLGVYHFTPCISWGIDSEMIGLEAGLELALRSQMCPLDEKTSTMAYFIVRAPRKDIASGELTQERLEDAARKLSTKFSAGSHGGLVRYCSLTTKDEGTGDGYDVMVLLGGFSLKKLLSGSIGKFKAFSENLKRSGDSLEVKDEDHPNIRAVIKPEELEMIEGWLRDYSKKTEDLINKTRKGGESGEELLEGWMKEGKESKGLPPEDDVSKSLRKRPLRKR